MLKGPVWLWFVVTLGGRVWGHVGGHIERAHLFGFVVMLEGPSGYGLWSCWEEACLIQVGGYVWEGVVWGMMLVMLGGVCFGSG